MEKTRVVVVGGGVIGLSIAAKLSDTTEGVVVLEKNRRTGQEVSSHNSGVIHSGIHYPKGSLKATFSVRGNEMLYNLCEKHQIQFKKFGKLTVAIGEGEIQKIENLKRQGEENGVHGLQILDREGVRELEPEVLADRALFSPSSGIIDPDGLMNYYVGRIGTNGAVLATGNEVVGIAKRDSGYEIKARSGEEEYSVLAGCVINSAGLYSDRVAAMVGIDTERLGYRIHYCKGDYFRISGGPPVERLVYPVPNGVGLGVHLTPDLSGSIRLGPNAYYVDEMSYRIESSMEDFRTDVSHYLPRISEMVLQEDSSGIRPKLQTEGGIFRDFVIREESDIGYPGFINLIGIESPGLTAAPAIAEYVSELCSRRE